MCLMCMQLSRMSNAAREEPAAARTGQTVAAAKEDYTGMEAVVVSPSSASAGYDGTTSTGLLPTPEHCRDMAAPAKNSPAPAEGD
jgi:hypothetical protein